MLMARPSTNLAVLLASIVLVSSFAIHSEAAEAANHEQTERAPDSDTPSTLQVEASAVGFFGPSGAMSPGARLGLELRPWERFGIGAGGTLVTTTRPTGIGDVDGLRLAGDLAFTIRHISDSIVSSGAVGGRIGWIRYERGGEAVRQTRNLYSQGFFRGRGEWSFAHSWYLLFQMELAFAVTSANALAGSIVIDEVRAFEADLSVGIGYRF